MGGWGGVGGLSFNRVKPWAEQISFSDIVTIIDVHVEKTILTRACYCFKLSSIHSSGSGNYFSFLNFHINIFTNKKKDCINTSVDQYV